MLEIYRTLCLKSLNFSFYLLLFPFANYYQVLQWFSFKILRGKLAREATRIYAFAHAEAFDRVGGGPRGEAQCWP